MMYSQSIHTIDEVKTPPVLVKRLIPWDVTKVLHSNVLERMMYNSLNSGWL